MTKTATMRPTGKGHMKRGYIHCTKNNLGLEGPGQGSVKVHTVRNDT